MNSHLSSEWFIFIGVVVAGIFIPTCIYIWLTSGEIFRHIYSNFNGTGKG